MDELNDLINRLSHMTFRDRADPPNTAVLILTQNEIGKIIEALQQSQRNVIENITT